MPHRARLAGPLLAALLAASSAATAQQNVCVIVIDDCGPELIGAYDDYFTAVGKPSGTPANTPAIDALLAARGVTFTRAWSAPVCTPARAQMLSGQYASRLGTGSILRPRDVILNPGVEPSVPLIPQFLAGAPVPYERVALGKWHLGSHEQLTLVPHHPLGDPPGTWFQRFAGPMFNLQKAYGYPGTSVYLAWTKFYAAELHPGVNPCTEDPFPPCYVDVASTNVSTYAPLDTTNDALSILPTLREPYFLWVAFNSIHAPPHLVPSGLPTTTCGHYAPPATPCDPGPNPTKATKTRCMLEALDAQIARLVCALDPSDTTVILVGDNGTSDNVLLPPYPVAHGKGKVYEVGVHVPLIVRSPLIVPSMVGRTCNQLVHGVDLLATVCDLANVDPAVVAGTDSVSFAPYLLGSNVPQRTTMYAEVFVPNFTPLPSPGWLPPNYAAKRHDQAIRDERFKLIRKHKRTPQGAITVSEEFYDLEQGGPPDTSTFPPTPTPDWFEQNDLLASGGSLPPLEQAALDALRNELLLYPTVMQ